MIAMIDVCSHSLGLLERSSAGEWRNRILIKKNTPIATNATELLLHPRLHFPLQITQGEDEDPARVQIVGEVSFDIPDERLLLKIGYDSDGLVTIDLIGGFTRRVFGSMHLARSANLDEEAVVATGAARTLQEQARELERIIFELVNEVRTRHRLQPLSLDSKVTRAARLHSSDMSTRNYYGHNSPEGADAGERLNKAGVTWRGCAENIGRIKVWPRFLFLGPVPLPQPAARKSVVDLAREAVDGWFQSEGHRTTMLDDSFSTTGVGVAVSGGRYRYAVYLTQDFCC